MLDLSTENKALCFEDSTLKPLYIFLYYLRQSGTDGYDYWQYFTTIDEAIVLESMELNEGILESNNFELGSFVVPSMKVQWENTGIRYKDMVAVPVQKIGDEYIAYFDGYISSEEISQDGQTVSAEIVSFIGERLDIDVLETVKGYSGGTLYEIIQSALSQTAGIWVYGSETDELLNKFKNANTIININTETLPQTLTANELLKQAGEFLGGHIVVKEKRVVDIDNMKNYQPSAMPIIDFIRLPNIDSVLQNTTNTLPSGYKRLEYIQSDGNQFINTGYIPNDDTRVEIDFQSLRDYLSISNPTNPTLYTTALFGSRDALNTNSFVIWKSTQKLNEIRFDIGGKSIHIDEDVTRKLKIKTSVNEIEINGKSTTIQAETFSGNNPIYILTNNTNGTIYERCAVGKLYSFKIYENGIIQRNMIPCIRESDNAIGMYDIVNGEMYLNSGDGKFISPNPIETYTLPYYINLYADKTNSINFDQIRVLTKTGDMLNYQIGWKDDIKTTYEIKDNIFFESLSAENWEYCENAVKEVSSYLSDQNIYYTDLRTIYAPFVEGGDFLIAKDKNQSKLPKGYSALDCVNINNKSTPYTYINTTIIPNSSNIEINIEFSFIGNENCIFEADAKAEYDNILMLYVTQNRLTCYIGSYNAGETFEIPYVPTNQKINFNLKCGNQQFEYSGAFKGQGNYFGNDVIYTVGETMCLGSSYNRNTNYKLYHFDYSQNGIKLCDMYPCIRQSDGAVGVYDIVQNAFRVINGNPNPKYESGDIIIPNLSTTTRGIHSMRADVLCKATNSNKN